MYPAGEFRPPQPGHFDIREQDVDLPRVLTRDFQSILGRLRFEDVITGAAQDLNNGVPESGFIVGNQDRDATAGFFRDSRGRGSSLDFLFLPRSFFL